MMNRVAATAASLVGLVGLAALVVRPSEWLVASFALRCLCGAGLLTLFALGFCALVTQLATRSPSPAFVRLDHFLPFMRKKTGDGGGPLSPWQRWLAMTLPGSRPANRSSARVGAARRWLKRMGPTVLSAPCRRLVQFVSFAVFLWLFLFVAWPYTAVPEFPARESPGWRFEQVDQAAGTFTFSNRTAFLNRRAPDWMQVTRDVHIAQQGRADVAGDGYVGAAQVVAMNADCVTLQPNPEDVARQLDRLLLEADPWSLWERRPHAWPSHYADDLEKKERWLPADALLAIDPLVGLSTAIASRSWIWSLACAGAIVIVCLIVPRGFCGYLCPLGTTIDLFDWSISRRIKRWRVPGNGWWVHLKYYALIGVLSCALCGVLISGYVAAIPVITRALLFLLDPVQVGLTRGWHQVPPVNFGHVVSLALFALVLGLGFLSPRFWCKYVCPSGALFSVGNLLRRFTATCGDNLHQLQQVRRGLPI